MGLDQYLEARQYVSKYSYTPDREPVVTDRYAAIAKYAPEGFDDYSDFAGIQLVFPVGYWRKANAIHGWFVENVQNGVDDCGQYFVSREKLIALRAACNSVLMLPVGHVLEDVAEREGLAPTQGFFFGSYDYDNWYEADIKKTVRMINNILTLYPQDTHDGNFTSFYYSSSW